MMRTAATHDERRNPLRGRGKSVNFIWEVPRPQLPFSGGRAKLSIVSGATPFSSPWHQRFFEEKSDNGFEAVGGRHRRTSGNLPGNLPMGEAGIGGDS